MPAKIITLPLSISNAYLLLGDRPVLIDAGAPKDGRRLVAALRQHSITPKDLSLIALTHGHTDHTGAVAAVAAGGAPVAISATDAPLLQSGANGVLPPTGPAGVMLRPLVRRTTFTGFPPQIRLKGPQRLDDYGVGAEMVPVGGHTPGSFVVLLDDGDAVVGDLIRGGFASGRIRPGYPLRHFFTEDRPGNRAAVQRVLDHNPTLILVGHGGPLAATDVRRRLDAIT
jgi:glyoxylase-like metal-dependent hydrolase (beta-lactamase superfamily II)